MTGRVRDPVAAVCEIYRLTDNITLTANLLGISVWSAYKCLITGNAYSNTQSEAIAERIAAGMTPEAIQRELNIAPTTYNKYVPYEKEPYISAKKAKNALRIARCRARKELLKK